MPTDRPYALLDYPAYSNVGDSAIWLGALELFRRLGAGKPSYTCCVDTYDADSLRRSVGDGSIFLSGGGNFGGLYPAHQALRSRVVSDFPDHPIVQLPQTLRFEHEEARVATRDFLSSHPDFTLFVRDRQSLTLARDGLGVRTSIAPDLAFALPCSPRSDPPEQDVVWLLRTDDETQGGRFEPTDGREPVDWPADPRGGLFRIQRHLTRRVAANPHRRWPARRLRRTYAPVAVRRLGRGYKLLAAGRNVVTDRLHGHVLCVLLGIPHVLLDNSYGKNRAIFEAWTHDVPFVRWAERSPDAVARALEDLRRLGGS